MMRWKWLDRRARQEVLHDFLDGLLDPAQEAEITELLARDETWRQEHRELLQAHSLLGLSLDLAPPPDLVSGALARIRAAQMEERARLSSPRYERWIAGLGLVGAAALAAVLGLVPTAEAPRMLGALTVEGVSALKGSTTLMPTIFAAFDWVTRISDSAPAAVRSVLALSVKSLAPAVPGMIVMTLLSAVAFWRAEHHRRERGMEHNALHFFA